MNVLANENFPRVAVDALRGAGHDVLWARTDMPGAEDDVILGRAQSEQRLVVTFDKDFGELAYRWGLPASCGVALFRLHTQDPDYVLARVLDAFVNAADWVGYFAVIQSVRFRASNAFSDCEDEDRSISRGRAMSTVLPSFARTKMLA